MPRLKEVVPGSADTLRQPEGLEPSIRWNQSKDSLRRCCLVLLVFFAPSVERIGLRSRKGPSLRGHLRPVWCSISLQRRIRSEVHLQTFRCLRIVVDIRLRLLICSACCSSFPSCSSRKSSPPSITILFTIIMAIAVCYSLFIVIAISRFHAMPQSRHGHHSCSVGINGTTNHDLPVWFHPMPTYNGDSLVSRHLQQSSTCHHHHHQQEQQQQHHHHHNHYHHHHHDYDRKHAQHRRYLHHTVTINTCYANICKSFSPLST